LVVAADTAWILVLAVSPMTFGGLAFVGTWLAIRRVLAGPHEPVLVEVVGIKPQTQQWVLERADDHSRTTVRLLGGRKQLVAGDTLLADGAVTAPPKSWRRMRHPILALTGTSRTLWAASLSSEPAPEPDQSTQNSLPSGSAITT
jgi:hypothetical protein